MSRTWVAAAPPPPSALLARGLVPRRRVVPDGSALPDRVACVPRFRSPTKRVATYARLCGYPLRDVLPATWLHVSVFPLHLVLLTAADFPFAPAGLVHVRNQMTVHAPATVGDALWLQARCGDVRAHPRGHTFDLHSEARVGDDLVWTGVSTYLARGPSRSEAAAAEDAHEPDRDWPPPAQQWRLPADLGRTYAAVSGDINPIHLSAATARLFGFPRTVVHGMWTHARALAALGRLPDAYTVDVRFRRPVFLPSTVGFSVDHRQFAVQSSGGRVAMTGALATP